jgi:hypothetical protein
LGDVGSEASYFSSKALFSGIQEEGVSITITDETDPDLEKLARIVSEPIYPISVPISGEQMAGGIGVRAEPQP